jgi:multicomponent Na+:H+ antiporter subunit E
VSSRRRRPYGMQWKMIAILTVVWVLLLGRLTIGIVLAGFALGLLVTLVFPLPPVQYDGRLRPLGHLRLVARLLLDLTVASFAVALLAFRREPPRSAMLRVDLRSESDLFLTLTSQLVCLVPGSIVVEARRRSHSVYLHVLGVQGPGDLAAARRGVLDAEARVIRAFGSRAQIAALDQEAGS